MNNNEKFLVIFNDGSLGLLSKIQIVNDGYDIDVGVGTITGLKSLVDRTSDIVNLDSINITSKRSSRRSKIKSGYPIVNIGAPSVINISHHRSSVYKDPQTYEIPDTMREDCWWDPLFFFLQKR